MLAGFPPIERWYFLEGEGCFQCHQMAGEDLLASSASSDAATQSSSGKASAASSTVSRASRCSGDSRRTSMTFACAT